MRKISKSTLVSVDGVGGDPHIRAWVFRRGGPSDAGLTQSRHAIHSVYLLVESLRRERWSKRPHDSCRRSGLTRRSPHLEPMPAHDRRDHASYQSEPDLVVAYLLAAGIFLLVAPRLALRLLLSTADYGVILPRLTGLLLIGLGMFVVQIIRYRVVTLYTTTLAIGGVFCVGFITLYILSRDPLFLVLLVVVGLGVLATSASYILDRREGAH
jgi:hypothetical protein